MTTRSLRARLIPAFLAAPVILAAGSLVGPVVASADECSVSEPLVSPAALRDDIVTVASNAGSFETLLAAAKAAGLAEALQGDGPFTVFAPSDDAFAKLPHGTIDALLAEKGRTTLKAILKRHVVAGDAIPASELAGRRAVRTLGGARIDVALGASGLTAGGSRVVAADISASNGLIHVIDTVILPPQDDIPALADKAGAFGTLLAAVKAAGLVETLQGGPFTVLAPTDDAFAALPSDTLSALLRPENREALTSILALHVLPGRVYAEDALGGARIESIGGQRVTLGFDGGGLKANGANVVNADLEASNGIVHVIDRVLIPEGFVAPDNRDLKIGIFSTDPNHEVRDLLDLRHGQGRAISSFTDNSGAKDAGLKAGDVILAIEGEIATSDSIDKAKRKAGAGGTVTTWVLRKVEVEVRPDH